MRTALTIAGSDSSGGAGVQADVKAMAAVGVHAATVITAVTAQNTRGVDRVYPMSPEAVSGQLESVLRDLDVRAIKTGMMYSGEIIGAATDILEDHEAPLVVDPVMFSGTGSSLSDSGIVSAIRRKLIPICELITPNRSEAEALAGMEIRTKDDIRFAAEVIGKDASAVLIKGGHFFGPVVVDYLYLSSEITEIRHPRLKEAGHGSGCVLSSYITAFMAQGNDVANAVFKARELIQQSVSSQYVIGAGSPIVNPMISSGGNESYSIIEALDSVADRIVKIMPIELVPKSGMNVAMAMKGATGPEQIAAFGGRMVVKNGNIRKGGPAVYGSAESLSYILMAVMRKNPEYRCVMNVAYSDNLMDVMEEVGLTVVSADLSSDRIAESIRNAIRGKNVPDAIVDKRPKKSRSIRLLAKDTAELMSKLEEIL